MKRHIIYSFIIFAFLLLLSACGRPSQPTEPTQPEQQPDTTEAEALPSDTEAPIPSEVETEIPTEVFAETPVEEDTSWKLVLVNADHPLPQDFSVDLKALRNEQFVDARIYPELQQMFDDARAVGIYPLVNESFRTAARQQQIMDQYIAGFEAQEFSHAEAVQKAKEIVAEPGTSEHQLGLAVDIIAEFDEDSTATWQWLAENCWRYGFILRYPEDKVEITGISYEPWHFRYVGVDAAKEIMDRGICLEEYLQEKGV